MHRTKEPCTELVKSDTRRRDDTPEEAIWVGADTKAKPASIGRACRNPMDIEASRTLGLQDGISNAAQGWWRNWTIHTPGVAVSGSQKA